MLAKLDVLIFSTAKNINVKDMINPNNKLPLSPKNNFGS
jgi:hypothetical protein